ncbi:hypothetical protein G3I13_01950 [Streptomyces sp. SID6673]|nr:hypothetical protein [Streptomyces sp. SID11726]NDZ94925.1 hypothetical protein [Streptomyces sp. SID11726]NEB23084.1 hypothetical protein [Streptomyces sp. SID6673]
MSRTEEELVKRLLADPELAKQVGEAVAKLTSYSEALDAVMEQYARGVAEQVVHLQAAFDGFHERLAPQLARLAETSLRRVAPPNWPYPMPDLVAVEAVLQEDGIPLVYVPRAQIVDALIDAATTDQRLAILDEKSGLIAEDCLRALPERPHADIEKQVPLVREAIEAFDVGYYGPAQALAVAVSDTYLARFIGGSYGAMKKKASLSQYGDEEPAFQLFRMVYSIAPVTLFLTPFDPKKRKPPPDRLSRHVTIHSASTDHVHKINALIAVMLAASLTATYHLALHVEWVS